VACEQDREGSPETLIPPDPCPSAAACPRSTINVSSALGDRINATLPPGSDVLPGPCFQIAGFDTTAGMLSEVFQPPWSDNRVQVLAGPIQEASHLDETIVLPTSNSGDESGGGTTAVEVVVNALFAGGWHMPQATKLKMSAGDPPASPAASS
jgi:hypothetical protein